MTIQNPSNKENQVQSPEPSEEPSHPSTIPEDQIEDKAKEAEDGETNKEV